MQTLRINFQLNFFFKYFICFYLLLSPLSHSASASDSNCYNVNFTGLKNSEPSLITFVNNANEFPVTSLPDIWDWRNVNGINWLTPVTKQQDCGDCVMHAMASVFEGQLKISSGLSWITPKISIAEGFHCGGGDCSHGWTGEQVVERAKAAGFVDSSCGEKINSPDTCSSNICSDANNRRWKLKEYKVITQGTVDVNKIRTALLHGPVLTNMTLYDDLGCYRWGVYRHESDTPPKAGHMIAIVGYHKEKRAWIVKNSWGTEWVDQGYGYIYEKDTSGIGVRSWSLYLPPIEGFVDIENIQDNSFLKNEVSMTLQSNTQKEESLYLSLTKDSQSIIEEHCLGPRCDIKIDTLKLIDGDYEIHSYTRNPQNQQKEKQSLVKKIQILNKEPSLKNLKNNKSLLTMTNKGFNFAHNSPIRPSQLEIRILNKENELLYKQSTRDVSGNMSIYITPTLLQQSQGIIETWISYGNYPLRFISRNKLKN